MTKSPGTKSPVSSTKKHRSASPSYATPRSAPSVGVFSMMNARFSGKQRVRLVVRERAVRLEVARTTSSWGRRSRTGGSIVPAMPLAASITTLSGRNAPWSTNDSTLSTNPLQSRPRGSRPRSTAPKRPAPGPGRPRAPSRHHGKRATRGRSSSRCTPSGCASGDADPTVESERADRVVEHLGPGHPESRTSAPPSATPSIARGHRRLREAHVPGRPRWSAARTASTYARPIR